MWSVVFYDSGLGRCLRYEAEHLKDLYYTLGTYFNSSQPTFREEQCLMGKDFFSYDKYLELQEKGDDSDVEYYDKMLEKLTEDDYLNCILDEFFGNGIQKDDYNLKNTSRYYLEDIEQHYYLSSTDERLILDWLKAAKKLHYEKFSQRWYTKNKKYYKKVERVLESWCDNDFDPSILREAFK